MIGWFGLMWDTSIICNKFKNENPNSKKSELGFFTFSNILKKRKHIFLNYFIHTKLNINELNNKQLIVLFSEKQKLNIA